MKRIIVLVIIVAVVLIAVQSFGMGAMNVKDEKRVYIYSRSELYNILKDMGFIGYSVTYWDVKRNLNGTELRFFKNGSVVIMSCDGSVKEINMPGGHPWFDDAHQVIFWFYKGQFYYKDSINKEKSIDIGKISNPEGIYFTKSIKSPVN